VDPSAPDDITALLKAAAHGDHGAAEELVPLVYEHLRTQARRFMRNERSGITLQSTALVHEAYMRLVNVPHVDWRGRNHFFAMSARIMRRILIDAARSRSAAKRGGGATRMARAAVDLDELHRTNPDAASASLCALDDALESLARLDPRRAKVIELRFFAGLSVEETADVLEVSPQTVLRDWRLARAWVARELGADPS
jgi:RNA polymerase sigma factor (TIGR02999 family)